MSDNKENAGIVFFIGLCVLSLAVGTLAPHQGWGWMTLGGGLLTLSIMIYLESGTDKQSK